MSIRLSIFTLLFLTSLVSLTASTSTCEQSPYLTHIQPEDLTEFSNGEVFININEIWHSVNDVTYDSGYYFLDSGHDDSDSDDVIFKCPCRNCGRLQTRSLLIKRKWKCSKCHQDVFTCPKQRDIDGSPW